MNIAEQPCRSRQYFNRCGRAGLLAVCWIALLSAVTAQTPPTPGASQGTPGLFEGDIAHRADLARATYSVKGAGVKVCVISDSLDRSDPAAPASALAAAVASGDIPASLRPLANQAGIATGEGLAMLEIVHKIAPGADLGFASGAGGPFQLAQNIRDLVQFSKCKIIVDDITDADASPFQDGAVARAINEATAAGVLFVSSAGNAGSKTQGTSGTWEGDFKDGGADSRIGTGKLHEFAPGQSYLTLTRATNRVGLFWSDPWFNSTNKYSLHVIAQRGTQQFLIDSNNTYSPYQSVFAGAGDSFLPGDKIYVMKEDGAEPRFLHVDTYRGTVDHGTNGNIRGHAGSENVITVAAVEVPPPAANGTPGRYSGRPKAEAQSSDGPRRIFFNADNTPINGKFLAADNGGRVVKKPDLAAASKVKTTLPAGTTANPTGLNPFVGTSAAAPHVAGIAALILSIRPNLTPAQVREILIASAGPGAAWDEVSGFGIPNAEKALRFASAVPTGAVLEFNGLKDGTGSYAQVPDSGLRLAEPVSQTTLHFDAFTLEAMVYWNGIDGYSPILSWPRTRCFSDRTCDHGRGFTFGLLDGKPMVAFTSRLTGEQPPVVLDTPLPAKAWTQVSVAVDDSGDIDFYVNGVHSKRQTNVSRPVDKHAGILIGREFLEGGVERVFGGRLADIRIWSKAIDFDESGKPVGVHGYNDYNSTFLLAHWLLNEGQGAIANDSSGRGHHATLKNGASWRPAVP